MQPTPGSGGERSHLAPCPDCGAANGVNALQCWNCESVLPVIPFEPVAIPKSALLASSAPADPWLGNAPVPVPFAERMTADHRRAAHAPPERDEAAPERLYAALGDASSRAARRRGAVATGVALLAIAAAAAGYAAFWEPVRIALSPAELSRAVQPEGPSVLSPAAQSLAVARGLKVAAGAAGAAIPVAPSRIALRAAQPEPSKPVARDRHGARHASTRTTAAGARSTRTATRQAAHGRAARPARTASTVRSDRKLAATLQR